jgi:hypothetical protein
MNGVTKEMGKLLHERDRMLLLGNEKEANDLRQQLMEKFELLMAVQGELPNAMEDNEVALCIVGKMVGTILDHKKEGANA